VSLEPLGRERSMRANAMRFVLTLGVALVLGAVAAPPASAIDSKDELTDRDQIVMNGRLLVPEGDTVDTAVLFHGSAAIEGTVTGSVVVFDGQTEISGHVQQDVFVFNGDVTVQSGAQIDGDLVTGRTPTVEPGATVGGQQQRISTRFDAGAVGVASRFAWWLGYSVSTLVLGLLLLLFAPGLDAAIIRSVRERMGASIGFGALVFFLLPIVAVLLLVIVVAIPLGLFMLLALGLLYTVGYVAGAHAIGRMLVKAPTSRFLAFLAGWGILRVLGLIPVLGGLAWTLASIFGLGVLWVASRRVPAEPMQAQAVPPAPTGAG
jgi:magnesium-transporting ATPase (P-type)